jgi:hypothetical protein
VSAYFGVRGQDPPPAWEAPPVGQEEAEGQEGAGKPGAPGAPF